MAAFALLVVFANIGRAVGCHNDIAKPKDQFGEVRLRGIRTLYLAPLSRGSGPSLSDQGMLLNHSGITPGSLRRCSLIGLDLLLAVQGAKSSEDSGRKRKGKAPSLPQKTSTVVIYLHVLSILYQSLE